MRTLQQFIAALTVVAVTVVMPLGAQNREITPPEPNIPEGFTSIFNGKDLTGWHISTTNHHGTTPDFRVMHGMIVGTQSPFGLGGVLLTDQEIQERRSLHGDQAGLRL